LDTEYHVDEMTSAEYSSSRALMKTTMALDTIFGDHEALKKVWDEAETTFFDFSDIARGLIRKEQGSEQKEAADARVTEYTQDEEYFRTIPGQADVHAGGRRGYGSIPGQAAVHASLI
jgi:hypothetical protein